LAKEEEKTVSEYQYYEFQAIDRPLTKDQIQELRSISSRAEITPRLDQSDLAGKLLI
jgi:hypothetical protein